MNMLQLCQRIMYNLFSDPFFGGEVNPALNYTILRNDLY